MFVDRKDAGEKLSIVLERFKDENPIVLAIPRGGIVTAYETVKNEMSNDHFFADKKVVLLLKPIKLHILEYTIKTLLE